MRCPSKEPAKPSKEGVEGIVDLPHEDKYTVGLLIDLLYGGNYAHDLGTTPSAVSPAYYARLYALCCRLAIPKLYKLIGHEFPEMLHACKLNNLSARHFRQLPKVVQIAYNDMPLENAMRPAIVAAVVEFLEGEPGLRGLDQELKTSCETNSTSALDIIAGLNDV
jgi:hypothetical protein